MKDSGERLGGREETDLYAIIEAESGLRCRGNFFSIKNSMASKKKVIVGLGELLWDLLPAGRQLGGAPANFAYIATLLGDSGIPASRVGCDPFGEEALARLGQLGLNADFIQRDSAHPTGTVKVEVDDAGQPRFEISERVAWDFLEWTPAWQQLAEQADAVCFGSLAQRSSQSRSTIHSFLRAVRPVACRVFDVNLRQHFYDAEILRESMQVTSIVKLNREELPKVMGLLGLDHPDMQESARRLLATYDLQLVCITLGEGGSVLISRNDRSEHPGFKVKVADTVGAGDAFTAALVNRFLRGATLAEMNETANRVGAWVASQPGATPNVAPEKLKQRLSEIG